MYLVYCYTISTFLDNNLTEEFTKKWHLLKMDEALKAKIKSVSAFVFSRW